jgi:adenosylmethionine-8-amino-7-oxononanoate aminotransferase
MTTENSQQTGTTPAGTAYADAARNHLWMSFTRHSTYEPKDAGGAGGSVPIIVRGEGAYIWDDRGRKYIDGRGRPGR